MATWRCDVIHIKVLLLLVITLWAMATMPQVTLHAENNAPEISLKRFFDQLRFINPILLTNSGDGTNRIFVAEQDGMVRVFQNFELISDSRVFLDIREKINSIGNEQGLLGLAFDPNYASNGYFYVYHTEYGVDSTALMRYSVSTDPNIADTASGLLLARFDQPFTNHNGGGMVFGPDGFLYLGLGDGGLFSDPRGHAQNTSTLLGSVIRIDVSASTEAEPYRVPQDNPFFNKTTVPRPGQLSERPEIWAYGLRNPWRMSFDDVTSELWLGDVGENSREEINIIQPSLNYGWNLSEGSECFKTSDCDLSQFELPVFEYKHSDGNCSITGGHVYRGGRLPSLSGHYVFADYCSGRVWAIRHKNGITSDPYLLVDSNFMIPSFGMDELGEIYVLSSAGGVYRFEISGNSALIPEPTPPPPLPTPTVTFTPTPRLDQVPTPVPSVKVNTPLPEESKEVSLPTPTPIANVSSVPTPSPTPVPVVQPATPTPTPFERFRLPFEGAPGLGLAIMAIIGVVSLGLVVMGAIQNRQR